MKDFAALLERLVLTPSRNAKIRLLAEYFAATPDPDRGYALAAITRDLDIRSVKPAMLRSLVHERIDAELFEISYDYVGDLAETISLIWPARPGPNRPPALGEVIETLNAAARADGPRLMAGWLDAMDAGERWALIKLVTGGLRIGVSARLAKTALAEFGGAPVTDIEEMWHALAIPYTELFAWLEGRGEKPDATSPGYFRPVMLACPLEEKDLDALDLCAVAIEWKWDGIRVQATSEAGVRRLYSRNGDDIGAAFPDVIEALDFEGVIDGELLVYDPDATPFAVRPFSELQKRLNRKSVDRKLLQSCPAFVRAYDALSLDGEDLRASPFSERRRRLEVFASRRPLARIDLSPTLDFEDKDALAAARAAPPDDAIEGVMLKRLASSYVPGRPKGEWWKWKREPFLIDAVLMYAQRGHGKRSSFYSDYTFGVWTDEGALTPVGKAYFGFTDEELKRIDKFVRENTTDRFGPVRQVVAEPGDGLVFEVAFEGLNASPRHKSGVAMRFPRINRIRWDKPPGEADRLEALKRLLQG
ncbi:MAG: cisplatin damage response ATP-dependent DNA ligase [Alphaproteobacteria bacterium]|nr:cisplatin damage response ATP-dependent DNA ligase [Alphaproteobacteria bacterium]